MHDLSHPLPLHTHTQSLMHVFCGDKLSLLYLICIFKQADVVMLTFPEPDSGPFITQIACRAKGNLCE